MIIIKTSEAVRESTRSNVNEAIRAILNFFIFFFTKIFYTHKEHKNHKKHEKHKKHKKHKTHISEQSTFFPLNVF